MERLGPVFATARRGPLGLFDTPRGGYLQGSSPAANDTCLWRVEKHVAWLRSIVSMLEVEWGCEPRE
jgi:hypothetical protein